MFVKVMYECGLFRICYKNMLKIIFLFFLQSDLDALPEEELVPGNIKICLVMGYIEILSSLWILPMSNLKPLLGHGTHTHTCTRACIHTHALTHRHKFYQY